MVNLHVQNVWELSISTSNVYRGWGQLGQLNILQLDLGTVPTLEYLFCFSYFTPNLTLCDTSLSVISGRSVVVSGFLHQ